jgi:hypothetical protein
MEMSGEVLGELVYVGPESFALTLSEPVEKKEE